MKNRKRIALLHYDTLRKQEQREDHSVWKGERGIYVFENTNNTEPKKPIRRVYLNRTYFSGLFRTKRVGEFSGDLKEPEGKKYLVFRLKGSDEVEILSKVGVG